MQTLNKCSSQRNFLGYRGISFFRKKNPVDVEESSAIVINDESDMNLYSAEDIQKIRDKSGLPSYLKEAMTGNVNEQIKFTKLKQYRTNNVRRYYAQFGSKSGLNPGVAWPPNDRLEFIKLYETAFYPKLQKLLADAKAEKQAEEMEKANREDEIRQKLQLLPKMKQEFLSNLEARRAEREEALRKKEKLIQEVREYLGYNVDPHDMRFQEALAKKEEEEKLKSKSQKKQDKQAKLLARLSSLGITIEENVENKGQS